jgi:hypothetical protein
MVRVAPPNINNTLIKEVLKRKDSQESCRSGHTRLETLTYSMHRRWRGVKKGMDGSVTQVFPVIPNYLRRNMTCARN